MPIVVACEKGRIARQKLRSISDPILPDPLVLAGEDAGRQKQAERTRWPLQISVPSALFEEEKVLVSKV
jgi:hypothetical protein